MPAMCFACDPLIPTVDEMNDPMFFCGGEPICLCEDENMDGDTPDLDKWHDDGGRVVEDNHSDDGCPNCGNASYPCACGGDDVLPCEREMWAYYNNIRMD